MSLKSRTEAERLFDAHVGQRIMQARKARGISGVKLAHAAGIDYRRLYWIETGGRCSLFLAVQISAALGVSLAELALNSSLTRKPEESCDAHRNCVLESKTF